MVYDLYKDKGVIAIPKKYQKIKQFLKMQNWPQSIKIENQHRNFSLAQKFRVSVLDTRPTTTTTHNGHFAQEPLRTGKAGSSKTWIGKIGKLELNLNNKGENKT